MLVFSELEQEIDNFKKENKKIISIKKKLQSDKDKLARELAEFENLKDMERKKMEEEKRRIKRDKLLLEKDKKEHLKGNFFNVNIHSSYFVQGVITVKRRISRW